MKARTFVNASAVSMVTAIGIIAMEETIVSTAIPRIALDLGGQENIGWIFSAYILTQVIASPVFGRLSDLLGRTGVFLCGLMVFLVGAFLAGSANSMTALVAARALQGIGAGAIQPIAYTVMADLYPGDQRGKMQGLISIVWTGAAVVGPLTGSVIVETLGWRWVFYASVPFALASLVFAYDLPRQSAGRREAVDWLGAALLTSASAVGVYLLLEGARLHVGVVAGLAALCGFFTFQLRRHLGKTQAPIVPLHVVKDRRIALANGLGFLVGIAVMSCIAYLPILCAKTLHFGPSKVALVILSVMLGWTLLAWGAGKLLAIDVPVRTLTAGGSVLMTAGTMLAAFVVFQLMNAQGTGIDVLIDVHYAPAALIAAAGLCGAGMGLATTTSMMAVQMYARPEDLGMTTSLQLFFRLMGQVFGAALFGGAISMVHRLAEGRSSMTRLHEAASGSTLDPLLDGYVAVFALAALASALALAVSLYLPSKQADSKQPPSKQPESKQPDMTADAS